MSSSPDEICQKWRFHGRRRGSKYEVREGFTGKNALNSVETIPERSVIWLSVSDLIAEISPLAVIVSLFHMSDIMDYTSNIRT